MKKKQIAKCNCKGTYLYNERPLPKTDLKNDCAAYKKTLVNTKDDTCKFCGYIVFYAGHFNNPRKKKEKLSKY